MQRSFPLFQGHLDLSQLFWSQVLESGDWAIDATCGNGRDTQKLAQILSPSGGMIAIDIQEEAISSTRTLLTKLQDRRIHFFQQCHSSFPVMAYQIPIKLIVYNLGYLPGGNKARTTQVTTTLCSVHNAAALLQPGGLISVTCYPGHREGAREQTALLEFAHQLNPALWSASHFTWINRKQSPTLVLLQKNRRK